MEKNIADGIITELSDDQNIVDGIVEPIPEKDDNIADGIIESIPEEQKKVYQAMENNTSKKEPFIKSKKEALYQMINAKILLNQRLHGEIDDADFAYALATDDKLRATTNNLAQQILQPTSIEVIYGRKDGYIDLAAGITTFWKEVNQEIPINIENATAVENIIMDINAGLDTDLEPDVRKAFLADAGIRGDQLGEFVTVKDYIVYETRMKEDIKLQIMEEMGISSEEFSKDDELLVESIAEDRMLNQKVFVEEDTMNHEPTYEEIYGMSAQDMYEMFAEDDRKITNIPSNGQDVSVDDEEWSHLMDMAGAEDAYYDMLNASIEENMAELYDTYMAERDTSLSFTEDDLSFVNEFTETVTK